jgi:hypothetical protein
MLLGKNSITMETNLKKHKFLVGSNCANSKEFIQQASYSCSLARV